MLTYVYVSIFAASLASASVIPRQAPNTGPMQDIPATGKAPNTFHNGAPQLVAEPKDSTDIPPAVYGARDIDLPFNRLYHGNMKYFAAGQLNTPTGTQDVWQPGQNDYANQSACGIPDNAYSISKVAIHPYFLKYADLSRYCMQDVCISFWKEDGTSDMMLKVTDICSTDPNDPTHCATPADIKIDRSKASIMEGLTAKPLETYPQLTGNEFPEKTWWFFMKCWADGLAQPAYQTDNWFTTPPLANNLKWAQDTATTQYQNNQAAYAAKGWPTYPNGAYNPKRDDTTSPPISDWVPGQEPKWQPIAGGKGWGDYSGASPVSSNTTPASSSTTAVGSSTDSALSSSSTPDSASSTTVESSTDSSAPSSTPASSAADIATTSADAVLAPSSTSELPSYSGAAAAPEATNDSPSPGTAPASMPLNKQTIPSAPHSPLQISTFSADEEDDTCEA